MAEFEVLDPDWTTPAKMKRMLLVNIRSATAFSHLIQTCKDNDGMTYPETAAYLRKNCMLIDKNNEQRAPTRLLHVRDPSIQEMSMEKAAETFTTMAEESGIETTFRMFNARTFRDRLGIPPAIWNEMEPAIREKVNEI